MRPQTGRTSGARGAQPRGEPRNGQEFAVATALARDGRYTDAMRHLRRALDAGDCSRGEALDLQARIHAQQGLHLEAEACWRQAVSEDGADGRYDKALARLRRARVHTGRGMHVVAGAAVIVLLGLVLWQVLVATPSLSRRLAGQQSAIASLRPSVDEVARSSGARDADLAASIAEIRRAAEARDARLVERIAALPTASDLARGRQAVIAEVAAAADELARRLETTTEDLVARQKGVASRQQASDEAAQGRAAAMEADLETLARSLKAAEAATLARIESSEESASERLARSISGVSAKIDELLSAATIAAVEEQLGRLREQMAAMTEAIKAIERAAEPSDEDPPSG